MQTYLYICPDAETAGKTIREWRTKHQITDVNFHEILPAPSIGIDAVRALQHIVANKPYGGGNRLIVLRDADTATVEAQNALLKILEEPPAATYIIVVAKNEERILPTIRSRSQIIRIGTKTAASDTSTMNTLVKILRSRPGERVLISQDISKTKEETLTFLQQLIDALESQLHQKNPEASLPLKQVAVMLKHAEHARRYVEGNINFKATLDILFLGFPKLL